MRHLPDCVLNEKGNIKRNVFDEPLKLDGSIKCLLCSKSIEPLRKEEDYKINCRECGHEKHNETQNVSCKDAITAKVHAGYGSDYDTLSFLLAVCDDCLEQALKGNRIVCVGRYI